jgi:membrane protease YdiL (CAAX protease family)
MEKKRELEPINLQLDYFFSILASAIWMTFFIGWVLEHFKDWVGNPIMQMCVSGGIMNVAVAAFLFGVSRSQKWPSMGPSKMHPLDSLIAGVRGMIQLFPLSYAIGILWQKILLSLRYVLNIDCTEQPMLALLRTELGHENQFWGIIFLTVVLAPIAEEIFFRYFLYRFGKSHMSSRRAAFLAAFVFALLHGNLVAFAPLWAVGAFLTFLYEYCGNLVPCIIAHSLFNYIAILLVILSS